MNRKLSCSLFIRVAFKVLLITTCGCIKERLTTVSTDSVTQITSNSALWSGTVISRGNTYVCFCGFCWSLLNENPDLLEHDQNVGYPSSDNYHFSQREVLTPGMNYFMRAYVVHDHGTEYGKVISFSTTGSITGDIKFNTDLSYSSLSDNDFNTYRTIKIGNQTWMAENLRTTKYNDGTAIPLVPAGPSGWAGLSTPAYCWYLNNEAKYKNNYGALYNWYCVNTDKLCPAGWHVPSYEEWETLIAFLGGDSIAGAELRETGTAHWYESDISNNLEATNSSGFTALPGGYLSGEIPLSWLIRNFNDIGLECIFWSSTAHSDQTAGDRANSIGMHYASNKRCDMGAALKRSGLSVRCVKN